MKSPSRAVAAVAAGTLGLTGLSFFAVAAPARAADPSGALGSVVINEFSSNGWNDNTDFIELHNKGAANVDLTGYHLTDDQGIAAGDDIVLDGVLPAGGYAVVFPGDAAYPHGFGLGKSDEVHLLSPDQATVIDEYVDLPADTHAAPSYARTTDGTGAFASAAVATPGGSNALSAADSGVSLNEYASDGTDFVEIRNNGLTQVDLTGWRIADGEGTMVVGDEIVLGGTSAVLAPGGHLSVATQAVTPPDGVTFVAGGFGLGKSDHVYLSNDEGTLVDTTWVGPEADGVTPRHASPSWARTAPGVGLWKLSAAATPGAVNSFAAGGGEEPTLDPSWDDVEINEISSLNAADPGNPGFGDAVELTNTGAGPVSIEGWYQVDSGLASAAVKLSVADLKVWNGSALVPATDMTIPAGGYVAFASKKGLSGEGDAVKVYGPGADAASRQLVDEQTYGDGDGGVSDNYDSDAVAFAALPDGSDEFWRVTTSTFGRDNTPSAPTRSRRLDTPVVVNEISNVDGKVELLNTGSSAVDISGWQLLDSSATVVHTVPADISLAPGAFHVAPGVTGLDSQDSLTLRRASDQASIVAHTWYEDGIASYSRCDVFGDVSWVETPTATWGAANACPNLTPQAWPGPAEVATVDEANGFGDGDGNGEGDASGAAFDPTDPSILWVVQNKNTLHKMHKVNGTYVAVDGWTGGKKLHFASGTGAVDSEGVTVGPDGSIYVTSERDNDNSGVSSNKVERYDVSGVSAATTDLTAADEWDVNSFVTTGTNLGPEGITFVPDSYLVASGWKAGGTAYSAAAHPTAGLFVTAVEATGDLHFFSLAHGAAPVEVKVESSGLPYAMDVAYDADRRGLWALCDDSCGGIANLLAVEAGDLVVEHSLARPAGMPDLNNEGMAVRPRSTAVDGKVEVVWTDDGDTGDHSLREGHLPADFAVPAVVTPPVVTPPTVPTAAELAIAQASAKVAATQQQVASLKAKVKAAKKADQPARAERLAAKLKKVRKKLRKQRTALAQAIAAAKG